VVPKTYGIARYTFDCGRTGFLSIVGPPVVENYLIGVFMAGLDQT